MALRSGRILTTKLESKLGNFLFFRAVGKNIILDFQQLRKYLKNIFEKVCRLFVRF